MSEINRIYCETNWNHVLNKPNLQKLFLKSTQFSETISYINPILRNYFLNKPNLQKLFPK